MPTMLSTRAERRDGVEILRVVGEIDLTTAPRLGEAIKASSAPGRPLVVDMSEVEFMDSAGARVLAVAEAAAAEHAAAMLLVPSEYVSRVFEITGLGPAFQVYEMLDGALEAARTFESDRDR